MLMRGQSQVSQSRVDDCIWLNSFRSLYKTSARCWRRPQGRGLGMTPSAGREGTWPCSKMGTKCLLTKGRWREEADAIRSAKGSSKGGGTNDDGLDGRTRRVRRRRDLRPPLAGIDKHLRPVQRRATAGEAQGDGPA